MKHLIFLFFLFVIVGCSKIPDAPLPNSVLVPFPNPTSESIRIHVGQPATDFTIHVFDPKGNLIFEESIGGTQTNNLFEIDLKQREKGSYHIVLKMSGITYTSEFVKI